MKILFKNIEIQEKFGSDIVHLKEIYIDEKIISVFYPKLGLYFIELKNMPYNLIISEEQYLTLVWFYKFDIAREMMRDTDVFDVAMHVDAKDSVI